MEHLLARAARRIALGTAAAVYHLIFSLARRVVIDPPAGPDPAEMPDPIVVLMAVEAARRTAWLQ